MTRQSIVRDRIGTWGSLFVACGWEADAAPDAALGHLLIRAHRLHASILLTATITETWRRGVDPDDLLASAHGCHLHAASWHAQFGSSGRSVDALRFDLARAKGPAVRIHEHPLGEPNHVRRPLPRLGTPEEWIVRVEEHLLRQIL